MKVVASVHVVALVKTTVIANAKMVRIHACVHWCGSLCRLALPLRDQPRRQGIRRGFEALLLIIVVE